MIRWACTGHNPTIWELGEVANIGIIDPVASVRRLPNGDWKWVTINGKEGVEPSRALAMDVAEKELR